MYSGSAERARSTGDIAASSGLVARVARSASDRLGAQRLRYRVFVEEMGSDGADIDHQRRLERDRFDDFADHIILIDPSIDTESFDHVVGAYRILRQKQAREAGGFYGAEEYDLSPLTGSGRRLAELGRSCIAPEHRRSGAGFLLWQEIAEYVLRHRVEILFGVASFHGNDPAPHAAALSLLHHRYRAPAALRPVSRVPLSLNRQGPEQIDPLAASRQMPDLLKAYLRLGGRIGEGGFVDEAFNTIDVCLVMETRNIPQRYRDLYGRGTVAPA